jgi:hypothetical protein
MTTVPEYWDLDPKDENKSEFPWEKWRMAIDNIVWA